MTASSPGNVHPIGRTSAPSLAPIMALVADGMNQVNSVILDRMQSRIPLIPELAGHLIAAGWKRVRPAFALTSAATALAAAVRTLEHVTLHVMLTAVLTTTDGRTARSTSTSDFAVKPSQPKPRATTTKSGMLSW